MTSIQPDRGVREGFGSDVSLMLQGKTHSISIIVAGDLCPAGTNEELLSASQPEKVFTDLMPLLLESDLAIVNLECPLTHQAPPRHKRSYLRALPDCTRGIRASGFDVASLANNHILDVGQAGLEDTLSACQEAGLKTVGAGSNLDQATTPLIVDIRGLRVAICAFAEHEFSIATLTSGGSWPLDLLDNCLQILRTKQHADFVLVILHGGNEYYPLPSPRMVKTCHSFVELGANAVICHHVHVPSGYEIYNGAPIVYSTGDLLFDRPAPYPNGWGVGYLAELIIQPDRTTECQLIPYLRDSGKSGVRRMTEDEAMPFLAEIAELSAMIADEKALTIKWDQFCSSKREYYLSIALFLNRIERWLLRLGLWPFWRLQHKRIRPMLNAVICESHRDVLVSVLSTEQEGLQQ